MPSPRRQRRENTPLEGIDVTVPNTTRSHGFHLGGRGEADRETGVHESPSLDFGHPSSARVYDALLGGKDNLAVDREAAERLLEKLPDARYGAMVNRDFLRVIVRWLAAEVGVRQFLDVGSGLPTVDNTHEVAQRAAPESRVVYIDHDPVVLVHGRAMLENNSRTLVAQGDLRDPWGILENPLVRGHLNFTEPIAVLLIAVMHFVPRQGMAREIVQILRKRLAPGSFVVVSHFGAEEGRQDVREAQEVYSHDVMPLRARTAAEIADLFAGLELIPPGVARVGEWLRLGELDVGVYDQSALARLPLICAIGRVGG